MIDKPLCDWPSPVDRYNPATDQVGSLQPNETQQVIKQYILYGPYCFATDWQTAYCRDPPILCHRLPPSVNLSWLSTICNWRWMLIFSTASIFSLIISTLLLKVADMGEAFNPILPTGSDYTKQLEFYSAPCLQLLPSVKINWLPIICKLRWRQS